MPHIYREYVDCDVWEGELERLLGAGVLAPDQVPMPGKVFNFVDGALTRRRPGRDRRDEHWMQVRRFHDGTVRVTSWIAFAQRMARALRAATAEVIAQGAAPEVAAFGRLVECRADREFQHWLRRTVGYWTAHPDMPARGM